MFRPSFFIDPENYLSVDQAAKVLSLSASRVRVLLAKGRLKGYRIPKGDREVWIVSKDLYRRPAKPGRPRKASRKAGHECGGEAAA